MTAARGRRCPTSRHVSNARARLIISNCAPVPALTFLIIGVTLFFFPWFFDTGTVDFPSEVSHWLAAFIGIQYLRRGILSEGSAFCLVEKHLHLIKVCRKVRILALFRGTGKVLWEASIPFGPLDISPSVRRRLADAGGATCSVYSDSSVRALLLVRRSPLLNKCWGGGGVEVGAICIGVSNGGRRP